VGATAIYPADDQGIYLLDEGVSEFAVAELVGEVEPAGEDSQLFRQVQGTVMAVRPKAFEPEWTTSKVDFQLLAA
jgi:hypothetical protein